MNDPETWGTQEGSFEMKKEASSILQIFTLGRFLVQSGDTIFTQKAVRSNKMWELFKFLLSHRGKYFTPEIILENLWPEKEYADPKSALRVQVNRMKQAIGEEVFEDGKINVTFSHGCYHLETGTSCRLDIDELENLSQKASELALHNPEVAINTYLKAISLYKGDYFPNVLSPGWVLPYRNYYRRLFLKNVLEVIKLLKNARSNLEIIKVCEKAFFIEYFEEDIHLCYMEALLEEGQEKQALDHYQYVTSLTYREIGAKPSDAMRSIYRLIKKEPDIVEIDLTKIQEMLKGRKELDGAFVCDPEFFRFLYKLEMRWSQRLKQEVLLGLLTLSGRDYQHISTSILAEEMSRLKELLFLNLRKGDVISQWNKHQFILLLPNLTPTMGKEVLKRIKNIFYQNRSTKGIVLHIKIQPLIS